VKERESSIKHDIHARALFSPWKVMMPNVSLIIVVWLKP